MSRAPRSARARRDWGSDDSRTPILHVDMDAFFASVEIMDNPSLAGKPVAVGGRRRGVVSAASYEARAFGVHSAMPVAQAYRRCPRLVMVPPRMARYREVSACVMEILRSVTPRLEQVSVDEAFLDVSGARRLFGSPVDIGQMLRRRIRQEAGVPSSVGIAATKHVAKIASAHAKPDGLLLVPASATLAFLHCLPVGAMWGVGEKTREILERRGIETVGDIARAGEEEMVRLLGRGHGVHLHELAMGIDRRQVVLGHEEKSIGAEDTFFDCLHGRAEVEKALLAQSDETAARLRRAGLRCSAVSVKVRFSDFTTLTRAVTLEAPSDVASEIYASARRLFAKVDIPPGGIRLVGVRATGLVRAGEGVQLAFDSDPRRADAQGALDAVRARFGSAAAGPATLLEGQGRRSLRRDGGEKAGRSRREE